MQKGILIPLIALFFVACGGGGDASSTSTAQTTPTDIPNSSEVVSNNSLNNEVTSNSTVSNTTPTGTSTSTSNLKLAANNTGTTIREEFNGYVLQIITSNILEESKETSQSTIAVYGTVNGDKTKSLLKLNTNYVGSTISVAVYKDEVLVAQSETFQVSDKSSINFGEISIN